MHPGCMELKIHPLQELLLLHHLANFNLGVCLADQMRLIGILGSL
jgi:hypothetical protein